MDAELTANGLLLCARVLEWEESRCKGRGWERLRAWRISRRCVRLVLSITLIHAGENVLFTKRTGDSQGFSRFLCKTWESRGRLGGLPVGFPNILIYTGGF
jgi:hypothetical protein